MRYLALASDYDGTLAEDGRIDPSTRAALQRCRDSGRKLLLVTGRDREDLKSVCDCLDLFDWVVAENGALLYCPQAREQRSLAQRPPEQFIEALKQKGVQPLAVGQTIIATWHPYEGIVLETIRQLGLELQVIFNKGAVMVLPSGVNKATGLAAALAEMKMSPHNVVGVGDAENDHAFLDACEVSAAVANAVPMLKQRADAVTASSHGAGVCELIEMLLADDLASLEPRLKRHHLLLGHGPNGSDFRLPPYGTNFLIVGMSGAGKSTLATAFLERMIEAKYQFCVIDPEGDYQELEGITSIGTSNKAPTADEVVGLLESAEQNVAVNLLAVPLHDRPSEFLKLMARLLELRSRTGRPHWILVDEAHHVLPAEWETRAAAIPSSLKEIGLVTLQPQLVVTAALERIDIVIAAGEQPEEILNAYARAIGAGEPNFAPMQLERGKQMALWSRASNEVPLVLDLVPGKLHRRRHLRKYAEGEIAPEHHFYFRGPDGKLKLRAQNLIVFLQTAEGVDEDTWTYHLKRGDYSRWFREGIKDDLLADEVADVEREEGLSADESRKRIREFIEQRYTQPGTTFSRPAETAEPAK